MLKTSVRLLFACAFAHIAAAQEVGSQACAQCHPAIARRYAATPMANSSGRVGSIRLPVPTDPIRDPSTQADIRLRPTPEGLLNVTIDRESPSLSVTRDLAYFLGSGRVGRSFLFAQEGGFLYQSPVSYYADGDTYRASPGFQRKSNIDLTRAVQPACLLCHASRLQPVAGTQNQYETKAPFLEAGVSCERCHGPGQRHVSLMKAAASKTARRTALGIVNPAKLAAAERASVCAQCHLTGAARVARAASKGRSSYRPGEDLARTVAIFVWDRAEDTGLTVTSHFEKLAWSACKQASGDRLWCGSCHDPHGMPVDVRARCASCHTAASKSCTLPLKERQARNNDQCQSCHMPKSDVRDAEHAVYTDHSIPRNPVASSDKPATSSGARELVPFWGRVPLDARDMALAYAVTALTEVSVRRRAFDLLRAAEAKDPADLAIAAQLAQFYDRMGRPADAMPLYERVVAGDRGNTAALINLGSLYAQANRFPEAIKLWEQALAANPALTQARMNLAVAQLRQGNKEAAVATMQTALHFDPDNPELTKMLQQMR